MPPDLILLLARLMPLPFVFAYGACVGSLLNVLAYRMPRGLSVVTPPSSCPSCGTTLTWRENIPIFGWLILRGRCRFCRCKISPEYPIVEAAVAVMFTLPVLLWYVVPNPYGGKGPVWLGFDWSLLRPEWVANGGWTWPHMALILLLLACLAAMTLIDAKTYTIPLVLPWIATAAGVVVHPVFAVWVQRNATGPGREWMADPVGILRYVAGPDFPWVIPTPGWPMVGASIGGVAGIGAAMLMLRAGLITRSFADYDQWEQGAMAEQKRLEEEARAKAEGAGGAAGAAGGDQAKAASEAGSEADRLMGSEAAEMWIAYPHARREMVRELAFLAPIVVLGYAGYLLMQRVHPATVLPAGAIGIVFEPLPPLWLSALGGSLLGYLVGGGLVWAIRVFGSLAFGKEAMGMGDVHLLAAVGACLGWIDAILTFFLAAFVGLLWAVISAVAGGKTARTMQYGPALSVATFLVLLGKPLIELGLNHLFPSATGVPPINIP